MARRKSYRGFVKFPGLGALVPSIPSSVKPLDVALGAGLGIAGTLALGKVASMVPQIPAVVSDNLGLAGGLATAGVLYYAQKRRNPSRAAGHAIGALLGAAVVWATPKIASAAGMAGMVRFPGLGGQYVQNPRLQGFNGQIFANPQTNLNMARLARMQGLGDDDDNAP